MEFLIILSTNTLRTFSKLLTTFTTLFKMMFYSIPLCLRVSSSDVVCSPQQDDLKIYVL